MAPRTILFTGKGGVGKTSVAAATAQRCARDGLRTLVLSTDPAHSMSEALEAELGAEPAQVSDRLWGQEVQAQEEMERNWSAMQQWLGEMLVDQGVDRISAEELTVPPGADELFSLLALKRHHEAGEFDVLVVAAARPIVRSVLDVPMPGAAVIEDVRGLVGNLIAMNEILRDRERATIRLVMNPDKMVIGEAMRTFTYLNLYGYLTDAVVVNRVFPDAVEGTYFGAWRERQREHLERVHSAFAPVPVLLAPYFEAEVAGPVMLDRLADELYSEEQAPAAVLHESLSTELTVNERRAQVRLQMPFADRGDISLKKIGPELVVRVDGQKRTIMLPPALAAWRPTEARLADGALVVTLDEAERSSTADIG